MSGKGAKIHKEREKRVCIFDFLLAHVSVDEYRQLFRPSLVNHTIFFVDVPGPVTGKTVLERLGFTDAFKWFPLGFFDKLVDAVKHLFVGFLRV
jgi:hypothetical protein